MSDLITFKALFAGHLTGFISFLAMAFVGIAPPAEAFFHGVGIGVIFGLFCNLGLRILGNLRSGGDQHVER